MRRSTSLVAVGLLIAAGGCKTGQFLDINDPENAGVVSAESLQVALRGVYDNLEFRRENKELTLAQLEAEMKSRAAEFARGIDVDDVAPADAWRAAEVFRTAEDWKSAARLYERAVSAANTPDRKVNDTLQLARCYVQLDRLPEGLKLARSAFSAPPGDKGAILPAVLLEIAPAAQGKGHDLELAALLVDACTQHLAVVVDVSTVPGKAYLVARRHHIRRALELASYLYRQADQQQKAAEVDRKLRQTMAVLPKYEPRN